MSKDLTVKVTDGGVLVVVGSLSKENVGEANYTRKLNLRRIDDKECRREGWILFKPDAGGADAQALYDGAETVNRLAELRRPNGEKVIIGASATKIKKFDTATDTWVTIGSGYSVAGKRWQTATTNGYLILNNTENLLVYYRVEDATVTPLYELREAGVAKVRWIEEVGGFLLVAGITEIQEAELATWMNGLTPYGIPPDNILNYYPWEVANSEFGQPINWAPTFDVTMAASSSTIVLPFPSTIFTAGVTRVAVINGGVDGGVLGGSEDTDFPEGVLVTGVAGGTLTLETPTDAALTYPRTVTVTRFSDVSTLSARYPLQGDGSEIVGFKKLGGLVVAYRKTGAYVGRYTGLAYDENGVPTGPFTFREKYSGSNVPIWGDCIASAGDEYHIYPAEGGRFYSYDGTTIKPSIHKITDFARGLFFPNALPSDECWAVDNPLTNEFWFIRPGVLTLAYDYAANTCSEIDAGPDAAAFVMRPDSSDRWFILAIGGTVFTYGLADGETPIRSYLRNGVAANWQIKSGLISFKDQGNEKDVVSYTPICASESPDYAMSFQLAATHNPQFTAVAQLAPAENLPSPEQENFVTLFFRAIYFQLILTGTDARDINFQISAHHWEYDLINASGVTRTTN